MITILTQLSLTLGILQITLASFSSSTLPEPPKIDPKTPEALVAVYFPPESQNTALRIIYAESGASSTAKNPRSSATGWFQITKATKRDFCPESDLLDPEENTACAAEIHKQTGWSRWNASKNKWNK